MPIENETFASRWSRRKQQVLQEESQDHELVDDVGLEKQPLDPEILREQQLAELNALTDEDMPDLDTLDEDSDYAGFMSTSVSESLRKLALQKLFHGKSFNIRDGLDEYDGDYTFFEKLDPLTITSDMRHLLEVEAEKMLAKKEQEEQQLLAEAESGDDFDEVEDEFDDELDEEALVASEEEATLEETNLEDQPTDNDNNVENEEVA